LGIGKSILKQKPPEGQPKLSKQEIRELQEYQERMREQAEQHKTERLDKVELPKVELPKVDLASGNVEVKGNDFAEVAPAMEKMSRPAESSLEIKTVKTIRPIPQIKIPSTPEVKPELSRPKFNPKIHK
jgi:hypothetical protein